MTCRTVGRVHIQILLLFLLITGSSPALSNPSQEHVTIVRGDGNYFPFEYGRPGKPEGLHVELIETVAHSLGVKVTFVGLPWMRAVHEFRHGKYDAISYFSHSKDRAEYAIFLSDNILSHSQTFPVVLASRKDEFSYDGNPGSLKKYLFAVGAGFRYGEPFDSYPRLKKYIVPRPTQTVLTKLLLRGRVDVLISSRRNLRRIFSEQEIDEQFVLFEPAIASTPNYLAFAADKQALAKQFGDAMKELKASGEYERIQSYYLNLNLHDGVKPF